MKNIRPKYSTIIIVAFFASIMVVFVGNFGANYISFAISFLYAIIFSFANFLYFDLINKFIGWDKNPKKTLWLSLLGVIPLNFIVFYILNFIVSFFIYHNSLMQSLKIVDLKKYIFVIFISMFIAFFFLIINFIRVVGEIKIKNKSLETEAEKTKFNSLKSQLDPHFLFNNLNVLTSLISENPEKAEEFTIHLSDIYRYVLDTEKYSLVDLKKEIDFARKYLFLLKMRFEDDLKISLLENLPSDKKIPPLSLQLLLENVIKHNIANKNNPLHIHIDIEDDYLIIKNNLNKRNIVQNSSKIGLNNLINRYELLSKKPVVIIENDEYFTVKIPIL